MPDRTRPKSRHGTPKPWLLPLRCNSQVDIVLEPLIRVHVPALQIRPRIPCCLECHRVHIRQPVPPQLLFLIEAVVAKSRKNTRAFRKVPSTVIFQACGEAKSINVPDPPEDVIVEELVAKCELSRVPTRKFHEKDDPDKALCSFHSGWDGATRYLALAFCAATLGVGDHNVKHAAIDPAAVFGKVKGRSGEEGGEEEL